jgi:hypothetical protein
MKFHPSPGGSTPLQLACWCLCGLAIITDHRSVLAADATSPAGPFGCFLFLSVCTMSRPVTRVLGISSLGLDVLMAGDAWTEVHTLPSSSSAE